jgi:hypothetical protein
VAWLSTDVLARASAVVLIALVLFAVLIDLGASVSLDRLFDR